jgi:hypothetical protein
MRASNTEATTMPARVAGVCRGDYLCSERALYHVEHLGPQRALLEDCRTGTLLDVSIADLQRLRPVKAAARAA